MERDTPVNAVSSLGLAGTSLHSTLRPRPGPTGRTISSPTERYATESLPQRAASRAFIAKGVGAPVSTCTQSPCAQGTARPKGGSPKSTAKLESAAARSPP